MARNFTAAVVIGMGVAGKRLADALAKGGLAVTVIGRAQGGDTGTLEPSLPPADLVVEAVTEDVATKQGVLKMVADRYGPETVVATTTSAIPLAELCVAETLRGRFIGLRMAGPPGTGKLVEATFQEDASADLKADVRELIRRLGLTPAILPDAVGTPLTRLLYGLVNDAIRMVGRGYATAEVVDTALTLGCGFTAGPIRMLSDIGAASARRTLDALYDRTGDPAYRAAAPLRDGAVAATDLLRSATADPAPDGRTTAHEPVQVSRVGVIGSGTMAIGIARTLAEHGRQVTVVARSQASAERVRAALAANPPGGTAAVKLSTRLVDVADCDLVVEAVVEDIEVKRDLLRQLDTVCHPATVLATTTSSLSVTACAAATRRPQRVVGLHFFNPAPAIPLVEVVTTDETDEQVAAAAVRLCEALGKQVIRCADEPGFVVNRLLFPYLNQAVRLVAEGRSPNDIDRSARFGMGLRMGPLRVLDVVGVDVALAVLRNLAESDPDLRPHPLLEQLAVDGYLGDKVGRRVRDHPAVRDSSPVGQGVPG